MQPEAEHRTSRSVASARPQSKRQRYPLTTTAYSPQLWNQVASLLSFHPQIVGTVIYSDTSSLDTLTPSPVPSIRHLAGPPPSKSPLPPTDTLTAYSYASATSFSFATPRTHGYHYANEAVSHTRNLSFLKKLMNGPYFDLEAIWDEHTYYEFEARDVPKTMSTMVQEPYVNHIPTVSPLPLPLPFGVLSCISRA